MERDILKYSFLDILFLVSYVTLQLERYNSKYLPASVILASAAQSTGKFLF